MPLRIALFARKGAVVSPIATRMGLFCCRSIRSFVPHVIAQKSLMRRTLVVALAFVCGLPLTTRAAQTSAPAPHREVTDELGRTIRVPQTIRRIVSLAPNLTETVYALGLQDRLVGDTDYCDYPPEAQQKPKVGGAINPSLETIASLHPDLVLVTKNLNRLETVNALDSLGIPSYATDPHTVEAIIASTERLADLLGAPETGTALGKEMERRIAATKGRIAALPPRRVLFVVWTEPLISIGKDTFIADALQHAGAISVVDSSQNWPQINLEQVVRLQPEFLVFAEPHPDDAARTTGKLADLPGWRILDAVKHRRYAVISDAVNRPAPRIASAIEDLARQLHPEAFAETPQIEKDNANPVAPAVPPPAKPPLPFAGEVSFPQEGACAR